MRTLFKISAYTIAHTLTNTQTPLAMPLRWWDIMLIMSHAFHNNIKIYLAISNEQLSFNV